MIGGPLRHVGFNFDDDGNIVSFGGQFQTFKNASNEVWKGKQKNILVNEAGSGG